MLEPMPKEPMFARRKPSASKPPPSRLAGWSAAIGGCLTFALMAALQFHYPLVNPGALVPVLLA